MGRLATALLTLVTLLTAGLPAGAADNTPFFRIGDPIIFEVGPQPRQFEIEKPVEATSYRFVNPCSVDVRIRKVDSMSQQVTARTGTRFLARTSETVATSTPRYVSLMTMPPIIVGGSTEHAVTETCFVELQYGTGN